MERLFSFFSLKIAIWRTIPISPFAIYQQSSNVVEPDMNIITCFTSEEFFLTVSFTLVDLKFLFQQSFARHCSRQDLRMQR